jgi:hypothetical protein
MTDARGAQQARSRGSSRHDRHNHHFLRSYNVAVTPISKPNAQRGTLQLGATRRLLLLTHRAATMSPTCRYKRTSPPLLNYLADVGENRRRRLSSRASRKVRNNIADGGFSVWRGWRHGPITSAKGRARCMRGGSWAPVIHRSAAWTRAIRFLPTSLCTI